MSFYASRNNGPYSSMAAAVYDMKEFLKSIGGTKNWSVVMSGDGLSAYSGTGDVITSGGSGANGFDNSGAWFVLEDPDSNRQILFSRYTVGYRMLLYYSKSGAFTGGSASSRATATDEETWMQARSTAYIQFPSSGSFYMHIVAEGDTADGDVYPWWCVWRYTGSGNAFGAFWHDCVVDSLSPAADSDKAILLSSGNQNLNSVSGAYVGYSNVSAYPSGYMRYGQANEEWYALGYYYYRETAVDRVPNNQGVNPEDGKYPVLPVFVGRSGGVTNGIKGQSNLVRWRPTSSMGYGDVVYDGTEYYLVVDEVMLRGWPDSTGPSI